MKSNMRNQTLQKHPEQSPPAAPSHLSVHGLDAWMTGPSASVVPINISKDTVTYTIPLKSPNLYKSRNDGILMRCIILKLKCEKL